MKLYVDALGLDWQDSMLHWRPLTEEEKLEGWGDWVDTNWIAPSLEAKG